MKVHSPAQHSGLRIQHGRTCDLGRNYGLDLIPCLGTPYATGWPKKFKKIIFSHSVYMGVSEEFK